MWLEWEPAAMVVFILVGAVIALRPVAARWADVGRGVRPRARHHVHAVRGVAAGRAALVDAGRRRRVARPLAVGRPAGRAPAERGLRPAPGAPPPAARPGGQRLLRGRARPGDDPVPRLAVHLPPPALPEDPQRYGPHDRGLPPAPADPRRAAPARTRPGHRRHAAPLPPVGLRPDRHRHRLAALRHALGARGVGAAGRLRRGDGQQQPDPLVRAGPSRSSRSSSSSPPATTSGWTASWPPPCSPWPCSRSAGARSRPCARAGAHQRRPATHGTPTGSRTERPRRSGRRDLSVAAEPST